MTLNTDQDLGGATSEIDAGAPVTMSRPVRPKSKRRARVLEPDQVAASRGEAYVEPVAEPVVKSVARPAARPATERKIVMQNNSDESIAKVGALTGIVSQIKGRFQKEEIVEQSDKPSVLAKAKEAWGKTTNVADDHSSALPVAQMAKSGSLLSRFNTPTMGVVAGIFVSGFGLFVASAVIA
jgi:hypothetical protein